MANLKDKLSSLIDGCDQPDGENGNATPENRTYRQQARLSFLQLMGAVPNCIIVIYLAVSTGSLVMYADVLDSLGSLFRTIMLLFLSRKLRKDLRYEYNYGIGKVEALTSMGFDLIFLVSVLIMLGVACGDIVSPKAPEALGFAVIFKVICVALDVFVYVKQRNLSRRTNSLVCKAELSVRLKSLIFDATSLIALVLLHFLSAFKPIWYLSPVVCILLSLYLIVTIVKRMRDAAREVLDKTANENVQMAILHALTTKYDKFVSFGGVDTRVSGGVVYVDLRIGFSDDTTAVEIRRFVNEVHTEILERVPECRVAVSIASTVSCSEEE